MGLTFHQHSLQVKLILKLFFSIVNQLYVYVCANSHQSSPTLCNSVDRSPPSSSVHGILQARILEWVEMPSSSRGSSRPRDRTCVSYISCIGRRPLYHWYNLGSPCICIKYIPFFFWFTSHLGHHRTLSRVHCAILWVLISYLFYKKYQ